MFYLVIGIGIGIFLGFGWARSYFYTKLVGTLKSAHDDDGTYLFLELTVPVEKVLSKKRVLLEVDPNTISQD